MLSRTPPSALRHRRRGPGPLRFAAGLLAAAGLGLVVGCQTVGEPAVTYLGDTDLQYYKDRATVVAAPAVPTVADDRVATLPPHTVADRSRDVVRDIGLIEAVHLCLSNSQIIQSRGQFLAPTNPLLTNPDGLTSIYDPAIQETNTQFFNRGVEAALSDFDANFTTQATWGKDELIQNNLFNIGLQPGQTLSQDTFQGQSRLQKTTAYGGTVGAQHVVNYEYNNVQNRLFPSVYTGNVQVDFRQPLLAGAGAIYNRTAGPLSGSILSGTNNVANGVLIARINGDIQIAELERTTRNLLREVEEAYWNLALAYRVYDADTIARESALRVWRLVQSRRSQGLQGGGSADEAQARDTYFEAKGRSEGSLGDLYRREIELRRLCGLPVNDGSILRPVDDPVVAQFVPDWHAALSEALTSRVELRRQKFAVKSLQLQLAAAKNLTQPRFDFISRYRVNGFGDNLLDGRDKLTTTPNGQQLSGLNSFYGTLLQGDQTAYDLGFEFSMPLGLRAARAQVRNIELRLAKSRASLSTMELEISHELAAAFQDVDRYYRVAQSNLNRRVAAVDRVRAYETRFRVGGIGDQEGAQYLDLLLRSQISLAQAEAAYWQSVIQYNQAIADVHLRQGTLLERDGVVLAEGRWTPQAYKQALREAWARSHAFNNPLLTSEPNPFVLPGRNLPTAVPSLPSPFGPPEGFDPDALPPEVRGLPLPPSPAPPAEDSPEQPNEPDDAAPPAAETPAAEAIQPIGWTR